MSADLFDLGLRLRARREGRAMLRSASTRAAVRPDALLVAVAQMPGDHAGLWALGSGAADSTGRPRVASVGDPRDWKQQEALWADVWSLLARSAVRCAEDRVAPQIVVASRPAAEMLEASSARFVGSDDADARRAAEFVQFCCQRAAVSGSQVMVVLADVLADHAVTGGEAGDESRLGVMLAWLAAAGDASIDPGEMLARFDNEDVTAGDRSGAGDDCHTPLMLDRGPLGRAVEALVKAERSSSTAVSVRSAAVRKHLVSLMTVRAQRLAAGVDALRGLNLPALPDLAGFAAADLEAWERWTASRDAGYRVWTRDRAAGAAISLTERENAVDLWHRALVWGDPLDRARNAAEGRVVDGVSDGAWGIVCPGLVRARPGDEFVLFTEDRAGPTVTIVDLDLAATGTVVRGSSDELPPPAGEQMQLCVPPPDFAMAKRSRIRTAMRVREPHWTTDPKLPAPARLDRGDVFAGNDPLTAAFALRSPQ